MHNSAKMSRSLPESLTSFGQQATIGTRGRYLAVMRGASPVSVTSMTTEASWSCAVRAAAAQTASRESACFGMRICTQRSAAVITEITEWQVRSQ